MQRVRTEFIFSPKISENVKVLKPHVNHNKETVFLIFIPEVNHYIGTGGRIDQVESFNIQQNF
jgi:hypothetical protein